MPEIDKKRLAELLSQFRKLDQPGADKRDHKNFDDREFVLDQMQTLLGLGMVMAKDIIAKAQKILSAP
jgi:hypothetical protein